MESKADSFIRRLKEALGQVEESLEKGKAFPVGTRRTWGGQDYVKHSDGWVAVGGGHHGKLMGKFKEEPTHKEAADEHQKTDSVEAPKEDKKESEFDMKSAVKQAEELGRQAFKNGKSSVPHSDKDLHAIMAQNPNKQVGASSELFDAWSKGFHSENLKAPVPEIEPKKEEPKSKTEEVTGKPEEKPESKANKPKKEAKQAKTPRAKAKKEEAKLEAEGEYANARQSKISNIGEDVSGSARHKAMEWKDLASAEKDGTADKLIKRDTLMKNEPVELELGDTNGLTQTALYLAVKSFPPAPKAAWLKGRDEAEDSKIIYHKVKNTPEGEARSISPLSMEVSKKSGTTYHEVKDVTAGELRKKARQEYYEAFQNIKNKAEELGKKNLTPMEATKEMREHIGKMIKDYRQADRYSDIGNALVPMYNNALSPVRGDVSKSIDKIAKKVSSENDANLNDIAASIMEGKSVDAALGQSKSKDKFSAASMYADVATRKGPEIKQKDLKSQAEFLTEKGGLRAIQWGNSVTDGEREHHLKALTESMQDLTSILNLPDEMISFNGRLGIAIGARGKGSALAHYEPSTKVINLTRKSGVGSLAHEWGHFFDNIVGKLGGKVDDAAFASQGSNGMTGHAISDLMESDAIRDYVKSAKDKLRSMSSAERARYGDPDYWFSKEEIFARTFERYVQYKLLKSGRENTYLAGLQTERSDGFFWASDEQMDKIAPHMDNVFKVFKESDDLKKALSLIELTSDLQKAFKEPKPDFYSAVIVIDYLGRVLLGKRHEDGLWTSPAGGGHYPESPVDCAIRELFEEAGIVAKPEDMQPLHVVDTANNKQCHCFLMTRGPGLATTSVLDPDQEIKKWGWYAMEDIPKDLIKDERRHSSVRAAYMKFYGIAKGGAGSGIVGHQTFHEAERNRHYEQGLKIQDILNKIEVKIKDRKKIDPSFKVPDAAKEVITELKNRRDEHSKSFKIHNDKHSLALQKEVDSEARAKLKKAEELQAVTMGLRYAQAMDFYGDELARMDAESIPYDENPDKLTDLRKKLEAVKLILDI